MTAPSWDGSSDVARAPLAWAVLLVAPADGPALLDRAVIQGIRISGLRLELARRLATMPGGLRRSAILEILETR